MTHQMPNGRAGNAAVPKQSAGGWTYADHSSAIRRRQDAARRLPPLACGRRDPIQRYPRDGRTAW